MKKFTCLLVACLAITSVYTACPWTTSSYNSLQRSLEQYQAGAALTYNTWASGTCNVNSVCCDSGKTQAAVFTEITKIKNQFIDFGSSITRIGGMMAKINTLVTASSTTSNFESALNHDLSGAAVSNIKSFATYSGQQYDTDFYAFRYQVSTCFDYYAQAVQKTACHGCLYNNADATFPWNTDTNLYITQASCNEWVTKCNKVWAFMHKAGWLVQAAAFLNKKRDTTNSVSYYPPVTVYAPGTPSVGEVDYSVNRCQADNDLYSGLCTDNDKANLCRAFVGIWSGPTSLSVGRSDTTFIKWSYNPTSILNRRNLANAPLTGAIAISYSGVDLTAANTQLFAPTSAIYTVDPSGWSSGYSPQSSASSGSSTPLPADSNSQSVSFGGSAYFSYSSSKTSASTAKLLVGVVYGFALAVTYLN